MSLPRLVSAHQHSGLSSKHAEAYSALLNKLSDPGLSHLIDQIVAPDGKPRHVDQAPPPRSVNLDSEFLYSLELIQLMENVWTDLRMFEKANRESPANRGWITIFRHWTHQRIFKEAWTRAAYTFNPLFQQFYQTLAEAEVRVPTASECGVLPRDPNKD